MYLLGVMEMQREGCWWIVCNLIESTEEVYVMTIKSSAIVSSALQPFISPPFPSSLHP